MDYIILYLGTGVNILTRQTWESMNKPRLDWSPFQLRLANQSKVLPIDRLTQVSVEFEGLRTYSDFKFIDIVSDTNPYPALLGIDWEIENQTIGINKVRFYNLGNWRFSSYEFKALKKWVSINVFCQMQCSHVFC